MLTFNAETEQRKGAKMSRAIRGATKGRFSHAMICTEPPTLVEAIGSGVSTLSLSRCFAHSRENVRVLRYPDERVATEAASRAQLEVGRDYSVTRAIASVFPERLVPSLLDKGIFCSALVAQVYKAAGAKLFSELSIDRATPATLDELPGLRDVTYEIFRTAPAPKNLELMCPLDGDRPYSPSEKQTEIANRYAASLGPTADRVSAQYPEAGLPPPITLYQIIQFVMDAMEARLKVAPERRIAFDAAVADLDAQLAQLIRSGELSTVCTELSLIDDETFQRNLLESFQPKPDIDILAMRGLLAASESHFARRSRALVGFEPWRAKSQAVAAYMELEEQVLPSYQRRIAILREILQRIS